MTRSIRVYGVVPYATLFEKLLKQRGCWLPGFMYMPIVTALFLVIVVLIISLIIRNIKVVDPIILYNTQKTQPIHKLAVFLIKHFSDL